MLPSNLHQPNRPLRSRPERCAHALLRVRRAALENRMLMTIRNKGFTQVIRRNASSLRVPVCMLALSWIAVATTVANASEPRIERLDSGLRVVVIEDRALPLASVQLWYRVGSTADPPTRAGLTHLARIALTYRGGLHECTAAAGLIVDARTFRDACLFHSFGPAGLLEFMLEIEAERIRPLSIGGVRPESAMRKQWAALLKLAQDEPESFVPWGREVFPCPPAARLDVLSAATHEVPEIELPHQRRLLEMVFGDHPYARPPAQRAPAFDAAEPEQLDAHLAQWFIPANATLLIHGDVETNAVLEIVRRRFAGLAWSAAPRIAQADRPAVERNHRIAHGDTAYVHFAWWMPAWVLPENVGAQVLMHHLCNSVDGPLRRRLITAGAGPPRWGVLPCREAGMLLLSVPLRGGGDIAEQGARVERIVNEELRSTTETVIEITSLRRAKSLAIAELRQIKAGLRSRAMLFGTYDQIAGDLYLARFDERRIERFTPAGLRAAAEHLLATRSATLVVVPQSCGEDKTDGSPPSAGEVRGLDTLIGEHAVGDIEKSLQGARRANPPPIERRPAGEFATCEAIRVIGLHTTTVVTLLPIAYESPGSLERRIARLGGRWSAESLRDILSYRGWTLQIVQTPAHLGFASDGSPDDWPQLIELQAELLRAAYEIDAPDPLAEQSLPARLEESVEEYADRLAFLAFCQSSGRRNGEPSKESPLTADFSDPSATHQRVRCMVVSAETGEGVAAVVAQHWSQPIARRKSGDAQPATKNRAAEPRAYWVRGDHPPTIRMLFQPEAAADVWRFRLWLAAGGLGRWHNGPEGEFFIPTAFTGAAWWIPGLIAIGYRPISEDETWDAMIERGRRMLNSFAPRTGAEIRMLEFGARIQALLRQDSSAGLVKAVLQGESETVCMDAATSAFDLRAGRIWFLVAGDSPALRAAADCGELTPLALP